MNGEEKAHIRGSRASDAEIRSFQCAFRSLLVSFPSRNDSNLVVMISRAECFGEKFLFFHQKHDEQIDSGDEQSEIEFCAEVAAVYQEKEHSQVGDDAAEHPGSGVGKEAVEQQAEQLSAVKRVDGQEVECPQAEMDR